MKTLIILFGNENTITQGKAFENRVEFFLSIINPSVTPILSSTQTSNNPLLISHNHLFDHEIFFVPFAEEIQKI